MCKDDAKQAKMPILGYFGPEKAGFGLKCGKRWFLSHHKCFVTLLDHLPYQYHDIICKSYAMTGCYHIWSFSAPRSSPISDRSRSATQIPLSPKSQLNLLSFTNKSKSKAYLYQKRKGNQLFSLRIF